MASYDIYSYARMIRDEVRTGTYATALRRTVTADSVVLDMGTGVGIWALLACQFGARKVYALEPGNVIQIAREIAAANGFADRIEFIQDFSTNITLQEKADLIVTEMHGILPMFEHNLPSIIDARRRLLSPSGVMIPTRETLWVAAVQAQQSFEEVVQPWVSSPFGFQWQPALHAATDSWLKTKDDLSINDCFTEPACWATLDYRTLEDPNISGEGGLEVTRNGTVHGLALWFETDLVDGLRFSNAPGQPPTIFKQGFFPWPEPVVVTVGDRISVTLRCDWLRGYHLWRWDTTIVQVEHPDKPKFRFRQSNFFDLPFSRAALQTPSSLPKLNEDGQLRQFVFGLMDGTTPVADIGRQAAAKFPERFEDASQAMNAVAELVQKYSD